MYLSKSCLVWCVTAVVSGLVPVGGSTAASDTLGVKEILGGMADADSKYHTLSITVDYTDVKSQGGVNRYSQRVVVHKNGRTGQFEEKRTVRRATADNPEDLKLYMENHRLWTGDMAYSLGATVVSENQPLWISEKQSSIPTDLQDYNGGDLLRGAMDSSRPVWDLLREQGNIRLLDSGEEVEGFACHVLESDGPYGEVKIWVDTTHEFVVRKAMFLKDGDSLSSAGIPLRQYENGPHRLELTLDKVKVESIGGHYVPMAGELRSEVTKRDGATRATTTEVKIESIDFEPDFIQEGAFVLTVPDGTIVEDLDVEGLKYTWRDGKLVPLVEQQELRALRQKTEEIISEHLVGTATGELSISPVLMPTKRGAVDEGVSRHRSLLLLGSCAFLAGAASLSAFFWLQRRTKGSAAPNAQRPLL